jgi:type I restriction enzyme R subunit
MTAIGWEYEVVEKPFCQQLQLMGWQWIEGDPDLPESTERAHSGEVFLRSRLRQQLQQINLRDGKPWLDDARLEKAINDLTRASGHRLLEINEAATNLLLKGTVVDGLPDVDRGRPQPVRFIDWEVPSNNDFVVINQFKVELTSGRGHVIPDAVCFVNGIPVVVAEFKSPAIQTPIQAAIDQLLRYTNQRREIWPTLYTEHEGVERLFHTNQLLIASDFFEARVGSAGAPPEAYLEWNDTAPTPLSDVADELGILAPTAAAQEARDALSEVGPEQADRMGTPVFFRAPNDRPEPLRQGEAAALSSQQILVAGMLRPAHLLDVIRNFATFQQAEGRKRKVIARYQQFRAVQSAVRRLQDGRTRQSGADRDERGGIIWHTQGSGKSLTMVFLVRKMRTIESLKRFKIIVVTDRTDLEGQLRETAKLTGETVRPTDTDRERNETPTALAQRMLAERSPDLVFAMLQKCQEHSTYVDGRDRVELTIQRKEKRPGREEQVYEREVTLRETLTSSTFPVLNESDEILVLVDEAHRSHTNALHRNLRSALPNAALIGFTGTPILAKEKTQTKDIFGDYIDKYLIKDAELDGATVPILYEGRTADGVVKDAESLDKLFENMFVAYTDRELAVIKAKYGTEDDVLEAPLLIQRKAQDMLRHYATVVMPNGYKAQVVATSRRAAVTYRDQLLLARDELITEIRALTAATLSLPEADLMKLDQRTRELVAAHPHLQLLGALECSVVISGDHNDPESWREWSDKSKQEEYQARFKRKLAQHRSDKTDPLAILVVNNMLITGFDAPVEQAMYLDRKVVAHDLLQAVARVNRTNGSKPCGYVIDYIGVAHHLEEALSAYDKADTLGMLIDILVALPELHDRHDRVLAIFRDAGITDLLTQVQMCVDLLEDVKTRARFINTLRAFYDLLNVLAHRPEVPAEIFRSAKLLGFINKAAANLYRDPALNLLGVAARVKALIDAHITARGVDPRIPPTKITDAEFERVLRSQAGARARAAQMQHAARYHIVGFTNSNPAYARKMSEKLEEILKRYKDDWDALERELRPLIEQLRRGDTEDFPGLDARAQVPFARLLLDECIGDSEVDDVKRTKVIGVAVEAVERIRQEVRKVGFWKNADRRELLTRQLVRDLDASGIAEDGRTRELAQRLVALAKENYESLVQS